MKETLVTAVVCAVAVIAVVLVATDRQAGDWQFAGVIVVAVVLGTLVGRWLQSRKDRSTLAEGE